MVPGLDPFEKEGKERTGKVPIMPVEKVEIEVKISCIGISKHSCSQLQ